MILSKIKIPQDKALTTYRDFVIDEIIKNYAKGGNVEIHKNMTKVQPSFSTLTTLIQDGCEFENILLGLRFASLTSAQRNVPVGVRGATYQDNTDPENPVTVNRTFVEWIKSFPVKQGVRNLNGVYYMKASYGADLLNSEELKLINGVTGVSVVEWSEVQATFANENSETPEL
jgi:hypothetical protein